MSKIFLPCDCRCLLFLKKLDSSMTFAKTGVGWVSAASHCHYCVSMRTCSLRHLTIFTMPSQCPMLLECWSALRYFFIFLGKGNLSSVFERLFFSNLFYFSNWSKWVFFAHGLSFPNYWSEYSLAIFISMLFTIYYSIHSYFKLVVVLRILILFIVCFSIHCW